MSAFNLYCFINFSFIIKSNFSLNRLGLYLHHLCVAKPTSCFLTSSLVIEFLISSCPHGHLEKMLYFLASVLCLLAESKSC